MEMESQVSTTKKFKVLIFPWLAAGHMSPYLELAKALSKNQHFQPFLCSTAINLTSIHNTFKNNAWDFPIEFIQLQLPHNADFPPQFHTTKDIPTHLKSTLMDAFQKSQPNFSQILNDLKPDLLIYDCFQPWAAKLALSMNIHCIHLCLISVAAVSFFTHHSSTRRAKDDTNGSYPFPEIHITEAESKRIFDPQANRTHDLHDLAHSSFELSTNFVLFNSCKEIEGKYMEYLSSLIGKKIVPLGPLVQEGVALDSHRHIIEWLESKKPSSVVYVSFGSEYFLSKEEMEELANGLELSNANFLWAIRFPEKDDTIKESLPHGFLQRVENRGLVFEGWAPQAKILKHPSSGGFVSHGGWNSTIESLYYGVPVIGVPIQYDQPLNTRSIVGLGVGVEVERDEDGRFDRVNIANAIKKVMLAKDGGLIKEKARELKEKLKIEKEANINGVLHEFLKICQKRQTFT